MAAINLSFESFEDMMEFMGKISSPAPAAKMVDGAVVAERVQQNPAVEDKPAHVPYGQQIAPNFPGANTSVAPAAPVQMAPVQPTQEVPPAPVAPPVQSAVQTTQASYTLNDLAGAAMTLMDKGLQGQLQTLLADFGVEALPVLPMEQYGNFATALRGLGAQI